MPDLRFILDLFPLPQLIVTITLVLLLWAWPVVVALWRKHPQSDAILITTAISLLFPPLWIVAIIWAYASQSASPKQASAPAAAVDRPGRFRVDGVDRETGMDTTWYCVAESRDNARVKGELQGILVTSVSRDRA